jgi:hypothetical protein
MHTTEILIPEHFRCARTGQAPARPGDLEDLFPEFTDHDRVGIASPRPLDGIQDAGYAVLACVTAFYEMRRGGLATSPVYPDYYVFYASGQQGPDAWGELDVWPPSQWVRTDGTAEHLLNAAVERGVTRLLWPAGLSLPQGAATHELRSVLLYGGDVAGIELHAAQPVEEVIRQGVARLQGLDPAARSEFQTSRSAKQPTLYARGGAWRVECYRPISPPAVPSTL